MNSLYHSVMNSEINPLRDQPPAQRFQIMAFLGMMWTSLFCAAAGAWMWYGELMAVHLLFALGFFITGLTFRRAEKLAIHQDVPVGDGPAPYDDVSGA